MNLQVDIHDDIDIIIGPTTNHWIDNSGLLMHLDFNATNFTDKI